jgi:hypothetical protein
VAGDITFSEADERTFLDLTLAQCQSVLRWLWYSHAPDFGYLGASELAARCRRRLWEEFDPTYRCGSEVNALGLGLRSRCRRLLELAERAGNDGGLLYSYF